MWVINLLQPKVVKYYPSISDILASWSVFLTNLLPSRILFLTSPILVLGKGVVTKQLMPRYLTFNISNFFFKFYLFVLYWLVRIKIRRIKKKKILKLFTFIFSVLYTVILTSLSTTSLNFFKFLGTVSNLLTSNLSSLVFKSFKPI